MRNKKVYGGIIGTCFVMALLIAITLKPIKVTSGQEGIVTVNDISVPKEEFSMFLQDEKALTVNYFTQKYGAEYGAEFWQSEYEGENPLDVAKQNALDKITKVKIEQQVAKEMGIISGSEFETILELMKQNESIYGAENLEAFQEYSVFHSKIMLEAEEKYKLKEAKVSEKEVKEKYEKVKETLFHTPDNIKAMQLEIDLLPEISAADSLEAITKDIDAGISVEALQQKYQEVCRITPVSKTYGVGEGKDENISEIDLLLKEETYNLAKNEMTYPIGYEEYYYIMICLEREGGGIAPFDEVQIIVEDMLKEEAFEGYIASKIEKANVVLSEKEYKNLEMN